MAKGPFSSLRNRVFLACTAVSVLALGFALQYVTVRATRSAEAQLRQALDDSALRVGHSYASRLEALTTTARLIADLPLLKALVATGDADTVRPVARDYAVQIKVPLLAFANREGRVLAVVGSQAGTGIEAAAVREALLGREGVRFRAGAQGVLQLVTVPMAFRTEPPAVEGALVVGLALDEALAEELRGGTESEVAFVADGRVLASSLEGADMSALSPALQDVSADVTVRGNEYVALSRPLPGAEGPRFVVLRSRTERLRFLEPLRAALLAAAALAVLGAVLLSYLVSRTVTRPLAEITSAMHEIARTGDFTRKLPAGRTSYDEDTRVLGSAFDTLLDSVVRFQREAAEKERLSALGRLSTVIAHEVRNPLMIIKASLRGLRAPGARPDEVAEAAQDIDHEVARLNRIVGDVLDFARPARLTLQPTDMNAVCRDAAAAGLAGEPGPRVDLRLAFGGGPLLSDPELLRAALVNVLGNAREAVAARRADALQGPSADADRNRFDIELLTAPAADGGVSIEVRDHGVGIAPGDLPHVFEPYFTTKRTGTGLGLAIARNIVLSLGGRMDIRSAEAEGTQIRIELPKAAPGAAPPAAAAGEAP